MRAVPKQDLVVGKIVDVVRTKSGLVLPDTQNNASVFVLVESIGPEVKHCKPGDIVLAHAFNHIYVRGGFHRVVFKDEETWCDMQDLSPTEILVHEESSNAQVA